MSGSPVALIPPSSQKVSTPLAVANEETSGVCCKTIECMIKLAIKEKSFSPIMRSLMMQLTNTSFRVMFSRDDDVGIRVLVDHVLEVHGHIQYNHICIYPYYIAVERFEDSYFFCIYIMNHNSNKVNSSHRGSYHIHTRT